MKNVLKLSTLLVATIGFLSCNTSELASNKKNQHTKPNTNKIQVLNFATFHMGETNDANSTEFDQHNKDNKVNAHLIAQKLAKFKPTVIIVETPPWYNAKLKAEYQEYLKDPKKKFQNPDEVTLLAYELGRLCKTKRIYGIDHKMSYNYMIGHQINNTIDSVWYNKYFNNPFEFSPDVKEDKSSLSLFEKLELSNSNSYLDFAMNINADMLTHAGTDDKFEGADEATKYYQRNLRMYSNLNRVKLTKEDRVFILMGSSHTAFFRDFMSRSPKYEMVNTFNYLN